MSCAQPLLRLGASAGVEQYANSVAPPRTRRRCTAAISANVLGDRSMQSTQGWAGSTLLLDVRSPDHHLQGPEPGIILLPPVDVLVQDALPTRSYAHRLPVQPLSAAQDPYEQPAPQRGPTLQQGQPRVQPCSGAAVMMRIKACRDSQELDRCMEECLTLPAFHAMHAAAALTHLAQLMSHRRPGLSAAIGLQHAQQQHGHVPDPPPGIQPGMQPANQTLQHPMSHVSRLAQLLVLHVWQRRAQLEPRQISNVLWALGRLHASRVQLCAEADSTQSPPQAARAHSKGHHLGRLIAHLATWAAEQSSQFQPQELSCLLHGLAQLGYVPPNTQWLACMLTAVQGSLEHMTPQGIANSVWAVSHWLCMDSGTVIAPRGPSIMLADTACPLSVPDLPAVPVLQRRAATARWLPVRHWSVRVMPERPRPSAHGESDARFTEPLVMQPAGSPASSSACDVEASATSMLQQLWRVTCEHLPAEACEPASRSAPHARGSWPTISLVLLSWSCARMQVLPPPSWQAGLAAATFQHLEHLSCHDTCNLAWTAARWRQLASSTSTSLAVSHAATLAMWGWADTALPMQAAQQQPQHSHLQPRQQPRPVWALPPSWITRLSARVSDIVATVAMDRAMHGRGVGGRLEPAGQQGRAATWHATQQTAQTGAYSRAAGSERAFHPHALPALLWSAQQLPMALPASQQNTVLACMLRVPRAFSPRDLILFASLEVEAAKRRAAAVVQPPPSSHSHRNAEDASRLTSISRKMQPVHTHTAHPHPQQSRSPTQGSCADPTGQGQPRVHAAALEPCDRVLSPNVYQLVWAAARHLSHGSSQSLEAQQQRVTLVALLAGMPQLCTATCRRVWRSVRAGLSSTAYDGLTPSSSQGMAYAYSPHQATQILHDMTSTGYHVPAPDLLALLSMALAPLQQQQQQQPMPSAGAAEMVINAAWAAVSCARAARISWRHRHMLAISPKAKQRWRRAQTSALAVLERTQPGAASVVSPSQATSRSTPHTSRALADASAMLLWSLTDMGAPTLRIQNAWPESMVPVAVTQLNQTAAPGLHRPSSGGALPHVYCVRRMPRLVLARGKSGAANPLRGQTMFKRGMRHFRHVRLRNAAPSRAPEPRQGHTAPYAQLLPRTHLLRWLAVCAVHAQCMRPHALLLLVSAADRVPRGMMAQPAVHQALVRLLEVVAKRVPGVLPACSSQELALLAARMARLAQCLHHQAPDKHKATSSSGTTATAAIASGMHQLLRSLACMATVLEAEWERRSASVSWSQAARFQTALTRLLTTSASGEELCA